jgi:hypothetical protein
MISDQWSESLTVDWVVLRPCRVCYGVGLGEFAKEVSGRYPHAPQSGQWLSLVQAIGLGQAFKEGGEAGEGCI